MCFTLEANEEAKRVSESVRNFIGQDGSLIRKVGNEAYLTFYNMTRNNPVGKTLTPEQKAKLLAIKKEDLTIKSITRYFGYSTNSVGKDKKKAFDIVPPVFDLRSPFTLKAGEFTNKKDVETTVGKFLFNKLFVEGSEIEKVVPNGYFNVEVNAKNMKKFSQIVADGCMQGVYGTVPTVSDYLKAYEFWGLCLVTIFSPSYSIETIIPNKQLVKRTQELLSTARSHNLADLVNVENTLVSEAREILKGTPGMYMFDSGARGSFENDFKNMQICIGAVENPITGEADFMTSNYMSGIKKEDIPAASNSVVNGEYPKAISTAEGGYMTKQFYAVFQSIILDEPGSDCGSIDGLTITLTEDNLADYVDQYIIDKDRLVLITLDLDKKYMNHPIKMRSPMYCLTDKLCSKCAGERYYKLGIKNIGLGSNRLSGKLQNASLKLRHAQKISVNVLEISDILK